MDSNHISDTYIIAAIQANDQSAFRLLYDKYWKDLYLRARKGVDEDEAKDMIQEVMLSVWNRRHHIKALEKDDLGKYLFTALKYRIISFYANTSGQIKKAELLEIPLDTAPDILLENKELKTVIEAEVKRMPGKMQQIFRMSRDENFSVADIAAQLNLSEQTVKNQIGQALKRLRNTVIHHHEGDWVVPVLVICYLSAS
ncbi:RNA polymerase sigma-70 factor (ECF subfamily) [Pedobacter cryoconitis]|uniref:RNA polymerase sigma factor n=1 Tax=Pedobacter cryoconitis TaxID=188932 RepID=UPI001613A848|nr:sigma-70 family RNA polymerase sigma factor [Pedobacter cryoconitis]MBB6271220.1 RNA polymerase sigma-70 factor (ECF subfamily) [Pedobacter cryoconitis]